MLGLIRTHWALGLGIFATVAVITLIVWNPPRLCDFIQSKGDSCPPRSDLLTLGALIGVAIITAVYAYHTFQLGKEAAKQANASRELAEQTVRQMHQNLRPIVVFSLYTPLYDTGTTTKTRVAIEIGNEGKGPVLNISYSIQAMLTASGPGERFHGFLSGLGISQPLPTQGPEGRKWSNSLTVPAKEEWAEIAEVDVTASYEDIYGNRFSSEQTLARGYQNPLTVRELSK